MTGEPRISSIEMMRFLSLLLLCASAALPASLAAQWSSPAAAVPDSAPRTITVQATVTGEDVLRAARRHLGVRYVLGGTTPRSFDCSGFVRYVYAEYGIALPRTAREQAGVGIAPVPGDLRPGDLLFFYGGRGAQHIAIYVGGDSIIHASSTAKRVRYDVLGGTGTNRTWFDRRLIAVRRVLPAEGTFQIPLSGGVATGNQPASRSPERSGIVQ